MQQNPTKILLECQLFVLLDAEHIYHLMIIPENDKTFNKNNFEWEIYLDLVGFLKWANLTILPQHYRCSISMSLLRLLNLKFCYCWLFFYWLSAFGYCNWLKKIFLIVTIIRMNCCFLITFLVYYFVKCICFSNFYS